MADIDHIKALGEAVYGPRWQSNIARDLCVCDRTVRAWLHGTTSPAPGRLDDTIALASERRKKIAEKIKKAVDSR